MNLEDAIRIALDGDAVMFAGAGFSLGAKDLNGEEFLHGPALAEVISRECGLASPLPIEDASELFVDRFGAEKLIEVLRVRYTASSFQPYHQTVCQIPWRRIYTTNYDDVIEKAAVAARSGLNSITLSNDIYKTPKDRTLCVHLNGSIARLDTSTIFDELKLTETSYLTESIAVSPWVDDFRHEVELSKAIIFLGFSLYDLDIRRILIESPKLAAKCFFVLGRTPSEATILRATKFGNPLSITVEDFSKFVETVQANHIPVEKDDFNPLSLSEFELPSPKQTTDRDFLELLLFGKYDRSQLVESYRGGKEFYMNRHQLHTVSSAVTSGARAISIDSDFGNGKTLFLEGLRNKFHGEGYRVFDAREPSDHTSAELAEFASLSDKSLLIFEHYARWFNEIEFISRRLSGEKILVFTERSTSHDVLVETLEEKLGNIPLTEINLDKLDEDEIDWFLRVFETHGFWGDLAGASYTKRRRFLQETCKGEVSSILLKLFESPQIKDRLDSILKEIKRNSSHFDILLSVLILNVVNHRPNLNLLAEIWGPDLVNRTDFRRNRIVQQFIDFGSSFISLKSPVVSEYLLRNMTDTNKIVSVLLTIATRISKVSRVPRYRELFKDLMRFRFVQAVLPEKGLRSGMIAYYENLKNLPECKSYPLFWLQYAIACTTTNEIERARKYFSTAYSLSEERGWDSYQIDNHYARFLLVEAMADMQVASAMENFRKSHSINQRQIRSIDRKRYPFRVASLYRTFFEKFEDDFSTGNLEELRNAFEFIARKIEEAPIGQQEAQPMRGCKVDMEFLLARIPQLIRKRDVAKMDPSATTQPPK